MEILYCMIDIQHRVILHDVVQSDHLTVLAIRQSLALHIGIHAALTTAHLCKLKRHSNITGFAHHVSRLSVKL